MASLNAFKVRAVIQAGYDKASLNRANKDIQQSFNQLAQRMKHINNASRVTQQTFAGVGASMVAAFAGSIAAAAAFEEQFVNVKKTLDVKGSTREIEESFSNISKRLRELVKLAPVTTEAINEIAAIGGQLGISANEIVTFTDIIQKLTVATNLSADQAALSMARLSEITGTTSKELDNLASSLVALGNNFAATESEIVTASLQIATATAQIGGELNQSAVDALAFATALKAIGQPSQAGATAIVRLMTELSEAVALGGSNLKLFADVAGLSVDGFNKLYEIDSTKAVALFIDGLNDTAKLGKTNIGVLQELGLGQVRTQKAILATAKASDTLFEAIEVANGAFIENNALNEEAERRYSTLVSEITKGKNVIKGEVLDFGLERLDTGTEAIRQINNAVLQLVKILRAGLEQNLRMIGSFTTGVAIFRAYRSNIKLTAAEMEIFKYQADNAALANRRLNKVIGEGQAVRFGKYSSGLRISEDESINSAAMERYDRGGFGRRGLRGSLNPFKAQQNVNIRRALLDNPSALEVMYAGSVPKELDFARAGQGFTAFNPGYLAGAGLANLDSSKFTKNIQDKIGQVNKAIVDQKLADPTTRLGSGKILRRLKSEQKLLKTIITSEQVKGKDLLKLRQTLQVNERKIKEIQGFRSTVFGRGFRSSGGRASSLNVLRREVLAIGDKDPTNIFGNADIAAAQKEAMDPKPVKGLRNRLMRPALIRRLNKQIVDMAGQSDVFNKNLMNSREELAKGNIKGGQLALAFDDIQKNSTRFRDAVFGAVKGVGLLAAKLFFVVAAFKVFEKFGERNRGVMQFTNSMNEMVESTKELEKNTIKLAQARELLADNAGNQNIVDILQAQVEALEKQTAQQQVAIRRGIGESFIEDIMTASFGRAKGGGLSGAAIERLISYGAQFEKSSEEELKARFGEAIGRVIVGAFDPAVVGKNNQPLPTINGLIEGLLFQEGGFDADALPSEFFRGTSAQIIEKLIEESGAMSGKDFIDFLGINPESLDINKFQEITGEMVMGLFDFVKGAPGAEDILSDEYFKPILDGLESVIDLTEYTKEEQAQFVIDMAGFYNTLGGLTGDGIREMGAGTKMLDENSPFAQAGKRYLKSRLNDFVAAGAITRKEVNQAGNSYNELYKTYVKASKEFEKQNKSSIKNLVDEFGVAEEAALKLAIRLETAFKEARKAMLDFTKPLPDNQFENFSLVDAIINTNQKVKAQAEFEDLINKIKKDTALVADELAKKGIAGGGLELARRFASSPGLAMAQEVGLRRLAGDEYIQSVLGSSELDGGAVSNALGGNQLGKDLIAGVVNAFKDSEGAVAQALIGAMDYAVEQFKKKYRFGSPSKEMMDLGEDFMGGLWIGMTKEGPKVYNAIDKIMAEVYDSTFGITSEIVAHGLSLSMEEIVNAFKNTTGLNDNSIIASLFNMGAGDPAFLQEIALSVRNMVTETLSDTQTAFSLMTAVTNAERAQVTNQLALNKAKFDYAQFLKSEVSLQKELAEVQRQRAKIEIEGQAGVITMSERANLLRQKISIDETNRKLRGEFTASEQLSINEQERKVAEYQRMFDLGVIDALQLEAEQDSLRDMKGEFKTQDEKELFLLEASLAEEAFQEAQRIALLEDETLQQLRDAEATLVFQLENFSLSKEEAYGRIEAAEEQIIGGVINLTTAQENLKANAPKYAEVIGGIRDHFDGWAGSVDKVLGAIDEAGNVDPTKFVNSFTPIIETLSAYAVARDMADAVDANTATVGAQGFQNAVEKSLGAFGASSTNYAKFLTDPQQGLFAGTSVGQLINDAMAAGPGKYGANKITGEGAVAQFTRMINDVLGKDSAIKDLATGQIFIDMAKAQEAYGFDFVKQLQALGFGFKTSSDMTALKAKNLGYKAPATDSYGDKDFYGSDSERENIGGSRTEGANTVQPRTDGGKVYYIPPGTSDAVLNDKLMHGVFYQTPFGRETKSSIMRRYKENQNSYRYQNYGPAYNTPGFKMGGRIPDMAHLMPRKMYMGGRDNMMRRALVGEYGPEEVRFVPGSGFLVKPLTYGGAGNNTIVQELNVQVTGVPADPTSARKAALEIRKALNRLDREGTAGGGITRR